jgi:hypothetical protein
MLPAVPEVLQALKARLAETIIPALPEDAVFAQEQAGLMLASLDWLIDVQAKQYLYEVVENGEYLTLLGAFVELAQTAGADADAVAQVQQELGDAEPVPSTGLVDPDRLRERNRQLKALTGTLYAVIEAQGQDGTAQEARRRLTAVARRQERRERAFYRMTGFTVDAEDLGLVLEEQSRSS